MKTLGEQVAKLRDFIKTYFVDGVLRFPDGRSYRDHAKELLAQPCQPASLEKLSAEYARVVPCPIPPTQQSASVGSEEWNGEALAEQFHALYETNAPRHGYETRTATRRFNPETPNGKLMIDVCNSVAAAHNAALRRQSARVTQGEQK